MHHKLPTHTITRSIGIPRNETTETKSKWITKSCTTPDPNHLLPSCTTMPMKTVLPLPSKITAHLSSQHTNKIRSPSHSAMTISPALLGSSAFRFKRVSGLFGSKEYAPYFSFNPITHPTCQYDDPLDHATYITKSSSLLQHLHNQSHSTWSPRSNASTALLLNGGTLHTKRRTKLHSHFDTQLP